MPVSISCTDNLIQLSSSLNSPNNNSLIHQQQNHLRDGSTNLNQISSVLTSNSRPIPNASSHGGSSGNPNLKNM